MTGVLRLGRALCAAVVCMMVVVAGGVPSTQAAVISGDVTMRAGQELSFGDGEHTLVIPTMLFNSSNTGVHGVYLNGTQYSCSNVDVAIAQVTDITTVTDASVFSYSDCYQLLTTENYQDFMFLLRGTNGYWAAFDVTYMKPGSWDYSNFEGTWYFQTDGTASFVPEPATLSLLAIGGMALLRHKK